jgi:NAD(P)-dependent dehydrogenase (short-subunit alcohol dehydrogenase family)
VDQQKLRNRCDMTGRVVIVTGGTRGIGRATATRPGEADFPSYLFVTQIAGGAVSALSDATRHELG